MCGIVGFISVQSSGEGLRSDIDRMNRSLSHRGPDDQGHWIDTSAQIALGHRRLSIIDLSKEGSQPMHSASGRFVLSYNGEIYNAPAISEELGRSGFHFRGHSDTEVLLSAIDSWGLESALERVNGMFAFALWDKESRSLSLARDRLGIKPMYYGWLGRGFVFASELRAIAALPWASLEIDSRQLALMLRYNYVPAPNSIYKGIYKLSPGSVLSGTREEFIGGSASFAANPDDSEHTFRPKRYWSGTALSVNGVQNSISLSFEEAREEAERLLSDAVRIRMLSDVPLGAFLSGGIDSSLVVALMQQQSSHPVKTFSIGFQEQSYNEAVHAKRVAQHLGTEHRELYLSADEAASVVPDLSRIYDEPFADSSQLPTYLVSKLAREDVTVSLSGDGGDELFYGYSRYPECEKIWGTLRFLPYPLRTLAAKVLRVLPLESGKRLYDGLLTPGKKGEKYRNPFFMLRQLSEVLPARGINELYDFYMAHWLDVSGLLRVNEADLRVLPRDRAWGHSFEAARQMMLLDQGTYLPDDILCKVDRASMAVSLEARVPILDHRFVEYAWSLPLEYRQGVSGSKRVLRETLYRYVPKALLERPKMGFGVPIGIWLRHELRDWAESQLSEKRLREEGFFKPEAVRRAWEGHLNSSAHEQGFLWNLLMFQAWHEASG